MAVMQNARRKRVEDLPPGEQHEVYLKRAWTLLMSIPDVYERLKHLYNAGFRGRRLRGEW